MADAHGFEVGNHTHDHIPLRTLTDDEVRKQVATGAALIEDVLPGYAIRSLALPLGSMPRDSTLAVRGSWRGRAYGPYAVLLVGANPAPSPFAKEFDPRAIPRIRTSHAGWDGTEDFAFSDWMRRLAQNPGSATSPTETRARSPCPRAQGSRLGSPPGRTGSGRSGRGEAESRRPWSTHS